MIFMLQAEKELGVAPGFFYFIDILFLSITHAFSLLRTVYDSILVLLICFLIVYTRSLERLYNIRVKSFPFWKKHAWFFQKPY